MQVQGDLLYWDHFVKYIFNTLSTNLLLDDLKEKRG
jgi:hypothetical protein